MQLKTKVYISAAVLVAAAIIGAAAWSSHTVNKLERRVANEKNAAEDHASRAREREIEAAAYREKIEYLEANLAEIQKLARKQDEELETLNVNSNRARGDVDRARRTRSIAASAAELCERLAEVGYGCE